MTLQRLVLDFRSEAGELVVRCLYRSEDGPNPGTHERRVAVAAEVARSDWPMWRAA